MRGEEGRGEKADTLGMMRRGRGVRASQRKREREERREAEKAGESTKSVPKFISSPFTSVLKMG